MPLIDYDLADLALYEKGFPHDVFSEHRRAAPVWWHPPTTHTPDGVGFWSVATHAESLLVMRDPDTYSSVGGGNRPQGGTILPDNQMAGLALNMMDDPRHQRVRRLVSHGLTPRVIGQLEGELRRRASVLIEQALARGECDFVGEVAAELPLQAISILLGTPEEDRHRLFEWIDHVFDFRDRDAFEETDETRRAWAELAAYGSELIAGKRAAPRDDMLSLVAQAELVDEDPARLTEGELLSFFFLLFAAGADTTRNAIAGGLLELIRHPAQRRALAADASLLPSAIEEMVRWSSPSAYNRRTATRDTELRGEKIRAGDKVVFWEASANRDELVFADAMTFDIRRQPNPHIGFGHGIHHCLGANLARLEMKVVFGELLARCADLDLVAPPEWTRSNKHTGLRHLLVRFGRA